MQGMSYVHMQYYTLCIMYSPLRSWQIRQRPLLTRQGFFERLLKGEDGFVPTYLRTLGALGVCTHGAPIFDLG